jgi:hypothetical protein
MLEEELEEEDKNSDEYKNIKEQIESLNDPKNIWEDICENWDVEYLFDNFDLNEKAMKELLLLWYEKIVFPAWYGHWKELGIDKTRNTIEQRYKEIKSIASGSISDPQKAASLTNAALQASHQTGEMMEYIQKNYDVSYGILDDLTNYNTNQWEEELEEKGLKVAGETTQYMYHLTSKENADKIKKEGLKTNQKTYMSLDSYSWAKNVYPKWPIFLSKKTPWTDLKDNEVLLKIDVSNHPLIADLPSLIDYDGYIDETGIWWEEDKEKDLLKPFMDDGHIDFEELLQPNSAIVQATIALTDTAATTKDIPSEKITIIKEQR